MFFRIKWQERAGRNGGVAVRLTLKEMRTAGDGTALGLVVDEQGQKYLFEPLGMTLLPKEKIYLALLRELRQVIRTPLRLAVKLPVIGYQGIERCGDETGLLIPFNEELWANWAEKGETVLAPLEVAALAQDLLEMVPPPEEKEPGLAQFYPGDLVPLGNGRWALLDPRVQQLLAPYRPGGEERSYYVAPEVIAGSPRTEAAYLYSLGLTLFKLATGEFPFPMADRRETVTAILREEPLDPRYVQPQIGEGLARFLLNLLARAPQDRPDIQACRAALAQAEAAGTLAAGAEEAARFRAAAGEVKAKLARKRQWYWRWQRYKWPLLAGVGLFLFVLLLMGRGGYEAKVTPASTPYEVVTVFYDGLARFDPVQVEEPLRKGVGRDFIDMVSVLHVTFKVRQAYELISEPLLELTGLTITEAAEGTGDIPVFTARYRLRFRQGDEWISQERLDRLVLDKPKKIWQIAELHSVVLAEERTPVVNPDPAGSLDRSNGVR